MGGGQYKFGSRILTVHCDGLGDAVFAIPFLRRMPLKYPGARFFLIAGSGRRELYSGLSGHLVLETKEKNRISEILENEFDMVFDLNGSGRHVTEYFQGVSLRYHMYTGFEKQATIKDEIRMPVSADIPRWKEYFSFTGSIAETAQWDGNYDLVTARASSDLRRLLISPGRGCPVASIVPGSAKSEKIWPASYFAEVIDFLKAGFGCKIVLLGNGQEIKIGEEITGLLEFPVDNLIGITTLGCAMEVIKMSTLVLGNDSGLFHIGGLLDVPALGLYGPSDPLKWSFPGKYSHVLASPTGKMEDIPPSQVMGLCAALMTSFYR